MMRSNIYIWLISALALFICGNSYACGPWYFAPYGYKMYRVYDEKSVVKRDDVKDNCVLWQNLTSKDIPLKDIEEVVYKYSIAQMKTIMSVVSNNAFASWIKDKNDKEIYDFLLLAKSCEAARDMVYDPWYYPRKNDGTYTSLLDIEELAKEYKGSRLKDRYALQAVRAMFSAGRFQECVDYWNEVEASLPDGLIKEMTRGYLVGAYFQVGKIDEALTYFTKIGDLNSIIFCLKKQGKLTDAVAELECIAQYAPDSERIPEILQRVVSIYEPWGGDDDDYKHRMTTGYCYLEDNDPFSRLYNLSVEMTKRKSLVNKAVWCYTASFLADLQAKPYDAWRYINQASQCSSSEYLTGSIRVMKMYLDAKVSTYDSAYEARLYKDLKWLDAQIVNNITDQVKECTSEYCAYRMRINLSYYYWNDMLRRILLSEVCPRMLDRGMSVRALQLANMADNRLIGLVDKVEGQSLREYRMSGEYNCLDYRSLFFKMMYNDVPVCDVISYVNRTKNANSSFDTFLNSRGYIDEDYFYDLIGTKYLKALNYDSAVKYLSKVSSSYQSRLNTKEYMNRDPFCMERGHLKDVNDYKLNFAKEMARLEKSISTTTDVAQKSIDLIRYGTGIRNSIGYCWALTSYIRDFYYDEIPPEDEPILAKVEEIYNEAVGILNVPDLSFDQKEMAAIALVTINKSKTALAKFPHTYAVKYKRAMCDVLSDYDTKFVARLRF